MKRFIHFIFWLTVLCCVAGVTAGSWWLRNARDGEGSHEAAQQSGAEAVALEDEAMDAETRRLTGLRVEPLVAAVWRPQLRAMGHVVDPGSLVALWTEHDMIAASLRASEAEVDRDRQLYAKGGGVSRGLLDQAEAVVTTDRLKKENVLHRLRFEWGKVWVEPKAEFMAELLAGSTMLVRAEIASSFSLKAAPTGAQVSFQGQEAAPVAAVKVLPVASVDSKLQGSAWLLVIPGGPGVPSPGTAVSVTLFTSGEEKHGLLIPYAAVVQFEGSHWAFVEDKLHPGKFKRRAVSIGRSMIGGYFVEEGFTAGESVVTTASATLLAKQTQDQTAEEE